MGMLFQVTLQAADVGEWEPKREEEHGRRFIMTLADLLALGTLN